jgi:hypothetical protein
VQPGAVLEQPDGKSVQPVVVLVQQINKSVQLEAIWVRQIGASVQQIGNLLQRFTDWMLLVANGL